MIKFRCQHCRHEFGAEDVQAHQKGMCPKCKTELVIPLPSGQTHNDLVPNIQLEERPANDTADDNTLLGYEKIIDQTEEPAEGRLLWFLDIWLYPLNLAGVIRLVSFWLTLFLFCPLTMATIGLGTEYIPIVYAIPIAYVLYYFTECIRDSAAGRFRAPDFWKRQGDDKWDFISQLLIVVGCIAICFCPVSAYFILTGRTDSIYWLLMVCGGFFFPMVLLAVAMFDSYNALNPILIIGSIFRTFFPYCGMFLIYCGVAFLFMKINSRLNTFWLLPPAVFLSKGAQLYLIFVAVGLLGRFFCKYEEKLYWEV